MRFYISWHFTFHDNWHFIKSKIRHSSPRTFIISDIHHLRCSSPLTILHIITIVMLCHLTYYDIWHFIKFDILWHFTFYDILHFMTFDISWNLKSDILHLGHSSPPTLITSDVHHLWPYQKQQQTKGIEDRQKLCLISHK